MIEGGEFYGGEFNVIAGGGRGSFNLYGTYGSSRYHMLTIIYGDYGTPYVEIYSPAQASISIGGAGNRISFGGNVDFSGANVTGLN